MDFTLERYEKILKAMAKSNYEIYTMENYLNLKKYNENDLIILRHDVDAKPERSMMIATIEEKYGIKSTYYFRTVSGVFDEKIICRIHDQGHEIGYHYEALDIARGDFNKALEIFEEDLKRFNKICEIKTICMHGNSFTKWDNRDLWKICDYSKYDIIGEAYLSIDFENLIYISDSSRSWKKKYKIKDIFSNMNMLEIESSEDLPKIIKNNLYNKIYLLIHPDQWSNRKIDALNDFIYYSLTNPVKLLHNNFYNSNCTAKEIN